MVSGSGSASGCSARSRLAEGFVHTFKRDYVDVRELCDAGSVLAQFTAWIDDYNRSAPHSTLGMRGPAVYRAVTLASRELTPPSVRTLGSAAVDPVLSVNGNPNCR